MQLPLGTVASIDTGALSHNLARVRTLAPGSHVLAVIKADAYGHGLLIAARALAEADGFGVARLAEAERLRAAGMTQRILLLPGVDSAEDLRHAARLRIDVAVGDQQIQRRVVVEVPKPDPPTEAQEGERPDTAGVRAVDEEPVGLVAIQGVVIVGEVGDCQVDVAVVGGGYTGLATAIALREEGLSVAVLEREFAGYGASGRNAGHLTPTIGKDLPTLALMFGRSRAGDLVRLVEGAIGHVERILEKRGSPAKRSSGRS